MPQAFLNLYGKKLVGLGKLGGSLLNASFQFIVRLAQRLLHEFTLGNIADDDARFGGTGLVLIKSAGDFTGKN
jgi:hypothetical protein